MDRWQDPGLGEHEGMSAERVRRLLVHAARNAHPATYDDPAWLFAGVVFRVGPRVGMNLCVHAGLDPYVSVRAQA